MYSIANISDNFTRPNDTTAYADEDLVANSTTAGSVTPLKFRMPQGRTSSVIVRRARLSKSGATNTNANFSLLLYTTSPTVANGDNGAYSSTLSGYLGIVALDMSGFAFSDDSGAVKELGVAAIYNTGQFIYGLLKAEAAYTPAAEEVFTATLEVEYV